MFYTCHARPHFHARCGGDWIAVEIDDPVAYARAFGETIPGARPSALLDLLAGRPSEIDVINGAIPAQAARAGLEAPVNEAVTLLVKARESALL